MSEKLNKNQEERAKNMAKKDKLSYFITMNWNWIFFTLFYCISFIFLIFVNYFVIVFILTILILTIIFLLTYKLFIKRMELQPKFGRQAKTKKRSLIDCLNC